MKGSWPDPGGRFTSWAYSHIVYPHQYIEKLKESSSAGLEYLDLDLWYPESLPDYDSLDCLKHLGILVPPPLHVYEEVGVNELSAAVPIPSLPASLETLTLYGFKPVSISFGSLVERVEAGQLPNLRAVTYQKLYGQDREETGEQTEDWQNDIKSLRKLGVELSIVSRPGSSIILPENENWPCQCWIFDLEVAWW